MMVIIFVGGVLVGFSFALFLVHLTYFSGEIYYFDDADGTYPVLSTDKDIRSIRKKPYILLKKAQD